MVVRLRMRKTARGRVFPVMEPYSRDTRDIRRDRPIAISMYLYRHGLILHYNATIFFFKLKSKIEEKKTSLTYCLSCISLNDFLKSANSWGN